MQERRPEEPLSVGNRLDLLSDDRRNLLHELLSARAAAARSTAIRRRRPSLTAPLSYAQRRLWILDQLTPANPLYNESFIQRFPFEVDVRALEETLNEIIRRHEILRTTFRSESGVPLQVIAPTLAVVTPAVDLRRVPPPNREHEALNLARQQAMLPFNLAEGPLLHTCLFQLDRADFIFLVTMHHIVCDAWSFMVFLNELKTLYSLFSKGLPSCLPELPIQYGDYAISQRTYLDDGFLAQQFLYWQKQLTGLPVLELPGDGRRPAVPSFKGGQRSFRVPNECFAALKNLSQTQTATMFMTALAAFSILLHRYTGQADFAIGVPTANRNRPELGNLIGFFVNTLVIRIDCSGDPTFRELLNRVRRTALDAQTNQDVPFEKLVEQLQPKRDASRNPLFQVTFQYLIQPDPDRQSTLGSLKNLETGTAKFDLRLDFLETSTCLEGYLEYSSDLFSAAMASHMLGHLTAILQGVATKPDSHISELPLLSAQERRQACVSWNATECEYDRAISIPRAVERCVRRNPDAVAVACAGRTLTYAELNRRANQLAHLLRRHGIGSEAPVAVCIERSLDLITAILAVLKAGGAYVPLEPAQPAARIGLLLSTIRPSFVLTREKCISMFESMASRSFCIDRDWPMAATESEDDPHHLVDASSIAYIICTSGSTGSPRAVAVEHRSVMNLINWHLRTYRARPEDRSTLIASPGFDASVWEIWPYLCCGSSIHIP
ncbi:MAG TPA: condensation domain-containing protein, partial [Blastocatellia bacterium]|nr:condensation domain-containing protein [Blastocatellia bacterium]